MRTYDIINAGPRNRFTASGRVVSNSGRLFQPQNLPRCPDWFDGDAQEATVAAFKADCEDLMYEDVVDRCTYAVRGCLIPSPGAMFAVADLSNIEGRVVAWLAGEQWKIEAFKAYDRGEGPDLYKVTAGRILGKPPEEVTKQERQTQGKVPELSGAYQGSIGAYRKMGGPVFDAMTDDEILVIVRAWRAAHPATRSLWYELDAAAREVIADPLKSVTTRGPLVFDVKEGPDGMAWMRIKLPSGAYLCYRNPHIQREVCERCEGTGKVDFEYEGRVLEMVCPECNGEGVESEKIAYEGVDQYTRQWKVLNTYGGKAVENATQSIARDVFMSGFERAMAAGFRVVLRVHDELVAEVPAGSPLNAEMLAGLMAQNDQWNIGLPLAAAGDDLPRYRKA